MSGKDVLLAIVIPLILAELGPWGGWLAGKLLPGAARLRYGRGNRAAIRAEEWSADIDSIPGQLSKLAYALGQLIVGSVSGARRKIEQRIQGDQRKADRIFGLIYRIPYALVRLAARRLGPGRSDIYEKEWLPELEYLLHGSDFRQLTACLNGTRFATGLYLAARSIADSEHRHDFPKSGSPPIDGSQ